MGIKTGYNALVGGWYAEVYLMDEDLTYPTLWESEIYSTEKEARQQAEWWVEGCK